MSKRFLGLMMEIRYGVMLLQNHNINGCHIDFTKATFVVFSTSILTRSTLRSGNVELVNIDVTQN